MPETVYPLTSIFTKLQEVRTRLEKIQPDMNALGFEPIIEVWLKDLTILLDNFYRFEEN